MKHWENQYPLDDARIHTHEWGTPGGRPVLLLHGYLDIAWAWAEMANKIGPDCHLVAPDARGHGDSAWSPGYAYTMYNYVTDFFLLADALGWESFNLVGHSMGANTASLMAGTFPARIQRLVLLEGFGVPGWEEEETPRRLAEHVQKRRPGKSPANKTFATFEELVDRLREVNPKYTPEHARDLAAHGTSQLEDGRWTWKFDPRMRMPNPMMYLPAQFRAFWARITAPTLQILGEDSPYLAFVQPGLWNIPGMRVARVPNAMHMIQHDNPVALAALVRAFLDGEDVGDPWEA